MMIQYLRCKVLGKEQKKVLRASQLGSKELYPNEKKYRSRI